MLSKILSQVRPQILRYVSYSTSYEQGYLSRNIWQCIRWASDIADRWRCVSLFYNDPVSNISEPDEGRQIAAQSPILYHQFQLLCTLINIECDVCYATQNKPSPFPSLILFLQRNRRGEERGQPPAFQFALQYPVLGTLFKFVHIGYHVLPSVLVVIILAIPYTM